MSNNIIQANEIASREQALMLQQEANIILKAIILPIIIATISSLLFIIALITSKSMDPQVAPIHTIFSILYPTASIMTLVVSGKETRSKILHYVKMAACLGLLSPLQIFAGVLTTVIAIDFYLCCPLWAVLLARRNAKKQLKEVDQFLDATKS